MAEDRLERFLREELRIVNRHAPISRPSLCDLLREELPKVALRDGTTHYFDPRELRHVQEIAGDLACDVRLPMVIEYVVGAGEGTYVVRERPAALAMCAELGLGECSVPLFLYRPQVIELRRKLRTTTTILISYA